MQQKVNLPIMVKEEHLIDKVHGVLIKALLEML